MFLLLYENVYFWEIPGEPSSMVAMPLTYHTATPTIGGDAATPTIGGDRFPAALWWIGTACSRTAWKCAVEEESLKVCDFWTFLRDFLNKVFFTAPVSLYNQSVVGNDGITWQFSYFRNVLRWLAMWSSHGRSGRNHDFISITIRISRFLCHHYNTLES